MVTMVAMLLPSSRKKLPLHYDLFVHDVILVSTLEAIESFGSGTYNVTWGGTFDCLHHKQRHITVLRIAYWSTARM